MLFDSAEVLQRTRRSTVLFVAISVFRLSRPSDYPLPKLNDLTPTGYGQVGALFTLSPEPHTLERTLDSPRNASPYGDRNFTSSKRSVVQAR